MSRQATVVREAVARAVVVRAVEVQAAAVALAEAVAALLRWFGAAETAVMAEVEEVAVSPFGRSAAHATTAAPGCLASKPRCHWTRLQAFH